VEIKKKRGSGLVAALCFVSW